MAVYVWVMTKPKSDFSVLFLFIYIYLHIFFENYHWLYLLWTCIWTCICYANNPNDFVWSVINTIYGVLNTIKQYIYSLCSVCVFHLWELKQKPFNFGVKLQLSTYRKGGFLLPHGCCDVISGLGCAVCTRLHQPRWKNTNDRPILCLSIAPPPCMTVLWHCQ